MASTAFSYQVSRPLSGTARVRRVVAWAVVALSCLRAVHAAPAEENWGQWRGPLQSGVAPKADPPVEWSETKNVKWKFKLAGEGAATPVIWDNLVFLQSAVPGTKKSDARLEGIPLAVPQFAAQQAPPSEPRSSRPGGPRGPGGPGGRGGPGGPGMMGPPPKDPYRFVITAVDRSTGKAAWEKSLREEIPHEGHHPTDGTFASASPVADADGVYAYFGSRGLYALDHKGNIRWQKDLGKMRTKMSFGEGSSPALHDKYLVVNWDHEGDDFVVALDKATGAELWRQPRDEQTSWSTPLIVEHDGKAQVVVDASAKVRSYDIATGKELWSVGPLTANAIPSAVAGNGLIYCMSGFRGAALFALKPDGSGDLTGTKSVVWTYNKDTPYVPSPLLYDEQLYFLKGNEATLSVLNAATGESVVAAERLEGLRGIYASPLGAAGRIYLIGRDGGGLVLKKGNKVDVLATNKLEDKFDASPAAVGQELFLRGKEYLYCLTQAE